MAWNADGCYDACDLVQECGKTLLEYLPAQPLPCILDIGCGTGELTAQLKQNAEHVVGVDLSAHAIDLAKKRFPNIEFMRMDACRLPWSERFDAVFSNAAFHWIPNQDMLLESVRRALKPGGLLLCELGAAGNISKIWHAFEAVTRSYGQRFVNPFYFPAAEDYRALLIKSGFAVDSIAAFSRTVPLPGGKKGLRIWLKQLCCKELAVFSPSVQEELFIQIENFFQNGLWDGKQWIADCRWLRVLAHKAAT